MSWPVQLYLDRCYFILFHCTQQQAAGSSELILFLRFFCFCQTQTECLNHLQGQFAMTNSGVFLVVLFIKQGLDRSIKTHKAVKHIL